MFGLAINAVWQEPFQGAGLLRRKLPAQRGHTSSAGEGQQLRCWLNGQQQLGAAAVITKLQVVEQMQPAKNLRCDEPQDSVALPQQLLIATDVRQRLFAQHFGVGPLRCCALSHQFVATFLKRCASGGSEALAQQFELAHQGVEHGFAVIE